MSKGLPRIYASKEYRDRMNKEVQEKFGDSVHGAFDRKFPFDINQTPAVKNYGDKFKLMSPSMEYKFNKSKRGMNPAATEFAPGSGGKKSKRIRKRTMSKKRKGTRRHYKRRKHTTKKHRRK